MKYFLLVYDRSTGTILEEVAFGAADRHVALARRFELEKEHRDRPEIEVIVLGSESREALEHTHARYFKTVGELARSFTAEA